MIIFNVSIDRGYLVEGVSEFPKYRSKVDEFPKKLITFEEAKQEVKKDNPDLDAYVCFYKDDQKFDSTTSGIWSNPDKWLPLLKHFKGMIEPDFSTYQDFPLPLKEYNTYRMRKMGAFFTKKGIRVIPNYRSSTPDTDYFVTDGIPSNSFVAIGTHGFARNKAHVSHLCRGVELLIERKMPKGILIYGSMPQELRSLLEMHQVSYRVYETDLMRRLGKHHV